MSNSLSDSHYNMWLSIIALIYADGQKHPDEAAFIEEMITKMTASDDQKSSLRQAAENPPDIQDVFPRVSEPKHRSQMIYFARLLFWSDGDFHHQEEAILNRLTEKVMSKVNLEAAMKDVEKVTQEFHAKMETELAERSWSHKLVDAIIFWERV